MSNIKQQIGQRILEARKVKGLTRKALAELTIDLKPSRINNWERGIRTPGPREISELAKVLEVSAAFLMCLSDEGPDNQIKNTSRLVPLLKHDQVLYAHTIAHTDFIPVSSILLPQLSQDAFALKVPDESMTPEIRVNDIIIIEPHASIKPGDIVLAHIDFEPFIIVCQYKQLSFTHAHFELRTLNDNWPDISVTPDMNVKILGKVVQSIRTFLTF